MKKYIWIYFIAYLAFLLLIRSLSWSAFLSVLILVITAIIFTILARQFYCVKGKVEGLNGLRKRMVWLFGTLAYRYWVFGIFIYLEDKKVNLIGIEWMRVISLTPVAIAGISLYFYINKIKIL